MKAGPREEEKRVTLIETQSENSRLVHFVTGYYIEMNLYTVDVHFQRKLTYTQQRVYFSLKEFFVWPSLVTVTLWLKKLTAVPLNIKHHQHPTTNWLQKRVRLD